MNHTGVRQKVFVLFCSNVKRRHVGDFGKVKVICIVYFFGQAQANHNYNFGLGNSNKDLDVEF